VILGCRKYLASQDETRPAVRDVPDGFSQRLAHVGLTRLRVGQSEDRVGVHVIHVPGGEKGVEEGFNRGAWTSRLDHAMPEVRRHLLITHRRSFQQRQDFVAKDTGKSRCVDGFEVGARPLDSEHLASVAQVVDLDGLDRRVPTAPDDEVGVGPNQSRPVDQDVERPFLWRSVISPQVALHASPPMSQVSGHSRSLLPAARSGLAGRSRKKR